MRVLGVVSGVKLVSCDFFLVALGYGFGSAGF